MWNPGSPLTLQELDDFTLLMRSLSIFYEQDRTAFSSEYKVKYLRTTANMSQPPPPIHTHTRHGSKHSTINHSTLP